MQKSSKNVDNFFGFDSKRKIKHRSNNSEDEISHNLSKLKLKAFRKKKKEDNSDMTFESLNGKIDKFFSNDTLSLLNTSERLVGRSFTTDLDISNYSFLQNNNHKPFKTPGRSFSSNSCHNLINESAIYDDHHHHREKKEKNSQVGNTNMLNIKQRNSVGESRSEFNSSELLGNKIKNLNKSDDKLNLSISNCEVKKKENFIAKSELILGLVGVSNFNAVNNNNITNSGGKHNTNSNPIFN